MIAFTKQEEQHEEHSLKIFLFAEKTGTAQNIGEDHSVFICFAPKINPKIAVSVYVENARGGGGTWAAPIASLVIEKYIRRKVIREDFEKQYMEAAPCQHLPLFHAVKHKKGSVSTEEGESTDNNTTDNANTNNTTSN
jgi:hypothetical protein